MRSEDESKLLLESDLRKALERQQITVVYQPITRLASNQLAGFEALMRWDHPTRGRLGAEDFIPLAEELGLIVELGSYVLGQALEEARSWHRALPRDRDPLFVSVNVSSRQLFRQDMVQEIRLMLAREAVPKGTLKLEITESLVMENPERAVEILTWLKTFGASLALDDFGTGYSSLSYLHRFPCDTIKVDRSLVRNSGLDGSTPLILRSVIALAHELGKEVVAEGVETQADASYLRSIGCEYGQGYYYGEPMSAKDVANLLAALASHRKRRERERARAPAERRRRRDWKCRSEARPRCRLYPDPAPCGPFLSSAELGVARIVDEADRIDPDLAQGAPIFAVDLRIEDQLRVGRAIEPTIGMDLVFELPGRPAGVAEREQRLVGSGALGDVAQDIDGGGEADAFVDRQRAFGLEIVRAMQHETAPGFDRPSEMHGHGVKAGRKSDAVLRRHDVELLQELGEADIGCALVDDDAHGAVGRMGAEINHRARKARIAHGRHGDEQLAVEIALASRAALCASSWHVHQSTAVPLLGKGHCSRGSDTFRRLALTKE